MPRRDTRYWGSPVMSAPLNHTRPELGAISPDTSRKNVVLPAPLGPMIERSSPCRTLTSTSETASRLPYARVRRSVRNRTASGIARDSMRAFAVSRRRACAMVPRDHGPTRRADAVEERDDRGGRQGLRLRAGFGHRPDRRYGRGQLRAHRRTLVSGGGRRADGPVDDEAARDGHQEDDAQADRPAHQHAPPTRSHRRQPVLSRRDDRGHREVPGGARARASARAAAPALHAHA